MRSRSRLGMTLIVVLALLLLVERFRNREPASEAESGVPASVAAIDQPPAASAQVSDQYAEAELVTALAAVCSGTVGEPAEAEWTLEQAGSPNELKALMASVSQGLSVSSSSEHLHLAALLSDDPEARVELLTRAIALNPADPFLIWSAVNICVESGAGQRCPLGEWEKRLIEVDSQNSESWVRVAANRYAAGEHDKALDAMRHASTAAESRVYWTDTIEMAERGLAAASDYAFPERAGMAFGFAAMRTPVFGDYLQMCKAQSATSVEWAHACLAYGELVERQGKTEMGVSIARALQKIVFEALGQLEQAAEIEQRIEARRQARLAALDDHNPAVESVFFSTPSLFSVFLEKMRSEGEQSAWQGIAAEVDRLLERRPELACEQQAAY